MKTIAAGLALVIIIGCSSSKEINVEMVKAELVRVDTVFRNTGGEKQQLTWKDKDNLEYVCFETMEPTYPVGTVMVLLRRR